MALVDYETRGDFAVDTPNRTDARNAIDPEVAVRLVDAWQRAHQPQHTGR